jgi:DNA helicase-2/ATP-dependent DNA helicase PcrA
MPIAYTDSQREAIGLIDQPLHVIACAGSGKTQVISARIVEILRQDGTEPENVIAFTFTDKAANELKNRVSRLVNEAFGDVVGLAHMFIGTMHGFCLDQLQTHVYEFLKYSVLTEVQNRLFVDRNSSRSGLDTVQVHFGPSAGNFLRRPIDTRLFINLMNLLREDVVDLDAIPDDVRRALESYTNLLAEHRYLDFSHILHEYVSLLEGDDPRGEPLRRHVQETIRYVVVDEYQDVNPLQERLVRALCQYGANVCVVGDDDQTIFQWRGSAVGKIVEFPDTWPGVRQIPLFENFRSSPAIVSLGDDIASRIVGQRLEKAMVSRSHQQFERGDLVAVSLPHEEFEAAWVCDQIESLRGQGFVDAPDDEPRGLTWSDFALLLRSVKSGAAPFVEELKRRRIPYLVRGMTGLFDTPEVQAARSSFLFIANLCPLEEVRNFWIEADLGLTEADLDAGMAVLGQSRIFEATERWGTYNIQRTFMSLLEAMKLREERVPERGEGATRGELVFYNLGKFSQAISDFEQINFQSEPQQKYLTFAGWLQHQAPDFYEESDQDAGFAEPNAVVISTIHKAKGMQWPVVFIPKLRHNTFPSGAHGGRTVWHVISQYAVEDSSRYVTSPDDERRLFYVAVTRSQKYLFASWSPGASNRARRPSAFFIEMTEDSNVLTREIDRPAAILRPAPRRELSQVTVSFSELKYYFECPYEFKLRFLYGFNAPIHEALGFGKSVHDCLAEMHKRAITDDFVDDGDIEELVDRHLHVPFAYPTLRGQLRQAAVDDIRRYLNRYRDEFHQTIHSELPVQITIVPGVTVDGRIDLIRRLDTGETCIVDFKSTERAQSEAVTRDQLHVYALGYQELTGTRADIVEILNLDRNAQNVREVINPALLEDAARRIGEAGQALRENQLPRLTSWCNTCATCDLRGLCRDAG